MASRPKSPSSTTRSSGTRRRKPATIDLEAKEVKSQSASKASGTSNKASEPAKETGTKPTAKTPAKSTTSTTTNASKSTPAAAASKTATSPSSAPKTSSASEKSSSTHAEKSGSPSSVPKTAEQPSEKKAEAVADKKSSSSETLGRAGSSASSSGNASAVAPKSPPPPASEKNQGGGSSFGGTIFSALLGAVITIGALGGLGTLNNADDLPLVGALYKGDAPTSSNEVEDLRAQLADMQETISQESTQPDEKIAELESALDQLQTSISQIASAENVATAQPDPEISERLAAAESRIGQLVNAIEDVGEAASQQNEEPSAELQNVVSELGVLKQSFDSIVTGLAEQTQSQTLLAERLASLEAQTQDVREGVQSIKASEKVALSVAVNALGTALRNDTPLTGPISAVEALAGSSAELVAFKQAAQNNLPSQEQLLDGLQAFEARVANPSKGSSSDSLSDRFWDSARSLVSFRSRGPQAGDDPLAILSRVEARIAEGELKQAKSEWAGLPEDVQQKGADWFAQLSNRIAAFELYDTLSKTVTVQSG